MVFNKNGLLSHFLFHHSSFMNSLYQRSFVKLGYNNNNYYYCIFSWRLDTPHLQMFYVHFLLWFLQIYLCKPIVIKLFILFRYFTKNLIAWKVSTRQNLIWLLWLQLSQCFINKYCHRLNGERKTCFDQLLFIFQMVIGQRIFSDKTEIVVSFIPTI